MIPVGVGRGLMSSMKRIANQEITEKRQKKTEEKKEVIKNQSEKEEEK